MCRILEVSRKSYYAWRSRAARRKAREERNALLLSKIIRIHADKNMKSYGSPRVHKELKRDGIKCGRNKVADMMRAHGIRSASKPRYRHTNEVGTTRVLVPNRLRRQFSAGRPNMKWTSDITYIHTREGWLYLAVIMDLYSRRIVGWAMSSSIDTELVMRALDMALMMRKPPRGLLLHSDQGSQYRSRKYQRRLWRHGIIPSMSRRGNCWDNAPMESFFDSLKSELIGNWCYRTHREARLDIFRYIEGFYNRRRFHSAIGYNSPEDYEKMRVVA